MMATEQARATVATVWLDDWSLGQLQEHVSDLNRRAKRHGMEPVTLRVERTVQLCPQMKPRRDERGRWVPQFALSEPLHCVVIEGVEPVINGWHMVARIEFDPDMGNLVHTVPGQEVDPKYRDVECRCDHCGTLRRRKDTFVLRHEDGQELLVGRNCLADFLRDGDAEKLAKWAEWLRLFADWAPRCDEDGNPYPPRDDRTGYPPAKILAYTSAVIRKWGWVSRAMTQQDPSLLTTSSHVWQCLGPRGWKFIEKHDIQLDDQDAQFAEQALAWAREQDGASDYLANIRKLAGTDDVKQQHLGLVCSILQAWRRACDLLEERKARPARVTLGRVGERLRGVRATVERIRWSESDWGVTTIVSLHAPQEGDSYAVLTWFASGDVSDRFREGEEVTVDCTVKSHQDHEKFGPQTVVNRVTLK